jgi:hypothetical protein
VIHIIRHDRLRFATLECDNCHIKLPAKIGIPGAHPSPVQVGQLRSIAQDYDWIYVIASVFAPGSQDLCAKCNASIKSITVE